MKFTIASTALIATMASAAPQRNVKLSRNLRESSPVTKALLTRARPYSRELEGEDEVQFDGSYNLKFSQCVDIKIYDEDNHAAYVDSIAAGTVVPTKSYVIFHVCTDATCDYEGTDDLYIVDLATYLGTVATYHAEKTQKFCEACGEFEDICNPEDDEDAADQGDEEEEQEEDGGEEGMNISFCFQVDSVLSHFDFCNWKYGRGGGSGRWRGGRRRRRKGRR